MGNSAYGDAAEHWSESSFNGYGWWWLWGPATIVFWLSVVAGIIWLITSRAPRKETSPLDRARQILAERYARGEIDTEEFQRRMDHLR
ncbi:hypothetical protein GCM10027176_71480 [Actinoallomurus bryophytorum]|uniref:Putative membrane protein n=1 Tax=Actinoallomurus bryophytorum TaxID=1490222 RepID=A0A543CUQ8_9ACTN|nr:SHOCT domain-containing protein [Actinoallomurus bryophytorum]TQM00833.1 putative membrane protein [Actinoallomurus bryophytorum]